MSQVIIDAYTDGGCRGNPGGIGAWAFVLVNRGTRTALERCDGVMETTNNRMEMQAAIEALKALTGEGITVHLHSDSQYVIKGISEWLPGWKARGWRKSDKSPVLNRELWEELDRLNARHHVTWQWVRGHNGHRGNERVDLLANEVMDRIQRGEAALWERRTTWT